MWQSPAAIAVTPLVRPVTSTGVLLSVVEPFPSWPMCVVAPALDAPGAWSGRRCGRPPAAIAVTPLARPVTSTGVLAIVRRPVPELAVVVEAPALDAAAAGQRRSVQPLPAAIAVTPLVRPVTSTGTLLSVVVPFPSWPPAFQPQHRTPPASRQRAGVIATRGDGGHSAGQTRDVDRGPAVDRRAVPQVADIRCSPSTSPRRWW